MFAYSILNLYWCQAWGWSQIWLPQQSLHLPWESSKFALSTANLLKPCAQCPAGAHSKVLSVPSEADVPSPSLPCSLCKVHTSLKGTLMGAPGTWRCHRAEMSTTGTGKGPELLLLQLGHILDECSLLTLACPRAPHCPQSHLFIHISLPIPGFPQPSGPSLAENKINPTKCPQNSRCYFRGQYSHSNSLSASLMI